MGGALAYLELFVPPVLLAALPGIIAVCLRRPRLGLLQIVLAVLIVFLPAYLDALEKARLWESGVIISSRWALFEPWFHAIICGVLSGVALVAAARRLPLGSGSRFARPE